LSLVKALDCFVREYLNSKRLTVKVVLLPFFGILVLLLFETLAVEDGLHVLCCQESESIHNVLLVHGIISERSSVDLQDVGQILIVTHLFTEIISCFKGCLFGSTELEIHLILFLEFLKYMFLDAIFLQLVDVHENTF
jgi:hypothetical protein